MKKWELERIDFEFYFTDAVSDADVGVYLVYKTSLATYEPPVSPMVWYVGYLCYGAEATDAVLLAVEEEVDKLAEEGIYVAA